LLGQDAEREEVRSMYRDAVAKFAKVARYRVRGGLPCACFSAGKSGIDQRGAEMARREMLNTFEQFACVVHLCLEEGAVVSYIILDVSVYVYRGVGSSRVGASKANAY